jgi:transposase
MLKRQRFSAEFKRQAVRQLRESGKSVVVLSRELGVPRKQLYQWAEDAATKGNRGQSAVSRPWQSMN